MPAPDLVTAELTLTGRITTASNATFLGSIGDVVVVYKPIAGESPLWDFPHGTLAHREVAAYLVSQALAGTSCRTPGCAMVRWAKEWCSSGRSKTPPNAP